MHFHQSLRESSLLRTPSLTKELVSKGCTTIPLSSSSNAGINAACFHASGATLPSMHGQAICGPGFVKNTPCWHAARPDARQDIFRDSKLFLSHLFSKRSTSFLSFRRDCRRRDRKRPSVFSIIFDRFSINTKRS